MRLVLMTVLLAALPIAAHAAGDTQAGRKVAEAWCKPCHAMGAPASSDVAPPFSDIIAARTPQSIAAFLANPHGRMPDIQLSRQQIEDVTAYILGLKGR